MGFRLDYELVVKGFLFRKGKMKIVISKLYKVPNHGKYDQVSFRHSLIINDCDLLELFIAKLAVVESFYGIV